VYRSRSINQGKNMINIDFTITCGKERNFVFWYIIICFSSSVLNLSFFVPATINFCLHLQLRSILPLLFRQVVYSIDHHIELMLYDMIFEN
jgi:hypothetical protein